MAAMNLRQDTRRRAEAGYSLPMISGRRIVTAVEIRHFGHTQTVYQSQPAFTFSGLDCTLVPQSSPVKSVRLLAQYW
jgi:hypothetical protein